MLSSCLTSAVYSHVLGPGQLPWGDPVAPAQVGLSLSQLRGAAARLQSLLPTRECFVVVKDGELVFEEYYGNVTKETKVTSDSMGKSFTTQVIGRAVTDGLVDLHKPIAATYGVKPHGRWTPHFGPHANRSFFPNLTAHHLLGQTSGVGDYEPGTHWTYDSGDYIEHLSFTLAGALRVAGYTNATSLGKVNSLGELGNISTPIQFANHMLGRPLGVFNGRGDMWTQDGYIDEFDFSAGGGQLATCRDFARFGQLLLNRGKWRNSDANATKEEEVFQLVDPTYMGHAVETSYPHVSGAYGYLTWLNFDTSAYNSSTHCCAPRWGGLKACPEQVFLDGKLIKRPAAGANGSIPVPRIDDAPAELQIFLGWLAKYVIVNPIERSIVVSVGNTWGSSTKCDVRRGNVSDGHKLDYGYDETVSLALAWDAIRMLTTNASAHHHRRRRGEHGGDTLAQQRESTRSAYAGEARAAGGASVAAASRQQRRQRHTAAAAAAAAATAGLQERNTTRGSCFCACPPDQDIGRCFSHVASQSACDAFAADRSAVAACPRTGVAQICASVANASLKRNPLVDWNMTCSVTRPCGGGKGVNTSSLPIDVLESELYLCSAARYISCTWSPEPGCGY